VDNFSVQCSLFKIGYTDLCIPSIVERNRNDKIIDATEGTFPFRSNYSLRDAAEANND
jgi:hypothetical protein